MNVKVDLSYYAAKSELVILKAEIDKSKTVPVDLSKLSNVVNKVVVKNCNDKLVSKVNNNDTSRFVLKT